MIDVFRKGAGPPVLLLHSAGLGAAQWRPLIQRLAERWHCLAPNQYGYGRSPSWPEGKPADPDAEMRLILDALDGIAEPVRTVAHSMGAWLALRAARARPERFRSLVLVEPVTLGLLRDPAEAPAQAAVFAMVEDVLAAFARADVAAAIERFTDYWYGAGAWAKVPPPQRMPIFAKAAKMRSDVMAVAADRAPLQDYAGLSLPVRILIGERTTPAVRRMAALLAQVLTAQGVAQIPGAGHMLPATHAAEFAAFLEEFWAR